MTRNVLFVDHAPDIGGAERSLLLLLKALASHHDWQPHLACVGEPIARAAAALGIPTTRIELPRLRGSMSAPLDLMRGARAIASRAEVLDAAILHANTLRATFYAALASRWCGRPLVWHMRDLTMSGSERTTGNGAPLERMGRRVLSTFSRKIVCNSHAVAATFPSSLKIEVVHNGLDVRDYDPSQSGEHFRRRYGIPDDICLVGSIGRLRRWKGHDRFIRIAARVASAHPRARFVLVGGNPLETADGYRDELDRLVDELELGDRFTFTGQLEDVRPALAALDVFVHCGDPEPFGLVNIEAMAMALPVVAFAHGALPEIVIHDKTGCLVAPQDELRMAEAVGALLSDPGRRKRWGQGGRERVETEFNIERVATAIGATYERLAPRHR